jgi:hypothetical protein
MRALSGERLVSLSGYHMIGLRKFLNSPKPIAAAVLIPTFGEARFARWAIESVRRQPIKKIEVFIICDGSPPQMVSFFKDLAAEDSGTKGMPFSESGKDRRTLSLTLRSF